jgi:hypothetical protein
MVYGFTTSLADFFTSDIPLAPKKVRRLLRIFVVEQNILKSTK